MSQPNFLLNKIINDVILYHGGHKEMFDCWHEHWYASFAELRGQHIPYHLEEWEDIYGIQFSNEKDALRQMGEHFQSSYSYCQSFQHYLDHDFCIFSHKKSLPEELQNDLNKCLKEVSEEIMQDSKQIRIFKMIHLGTHWLLLERLLMYTLEAISKLDMTTKSQLRAIPDSELNEELMAIARVKAREMMAYYKVSIAA